MMSDERWATLKKYLLSLDVWDEPECEEIAAEVDRLREENARLDSEAEASLEKMTALMAERNAAEADSALRRKQIDALQSALESECERNREQEDALLARLAEADKFINGLVSFTPDPEDGPEEYMRWAKSFAGHYLRKHTAPPAAQPAEPQHPTAAGEE